MAVKKITETRIIEIEKSTAKTLPDNPSARGYSPEVIKRRLSIAHRKVLEELNIVIDDINSNFEGSESVIGELSTAITNINSAIDSINETLDNQPSITASGIIVFQSMESAESSNVEDESYAFIKIN